MLKCPSFFQCIGQKTSEAKPDMVELPLTEMEETPQWVSSTGAEHVCHISTCKHIMTWQVIVAWTPKQSNETIDESICQEKDKRKTN